MTMDAMAMRTSAPPSSDASIVSIDRFRPCRDAAVLDRNSMDALSDVLKTVRLEGALYLNAEFTAPWCINARYGQMRVRQRLAGADHVIPFHYVIDGQCKVRLEEGGETIDAVAGDLLLIPRDDRHLMGSDLSCPPLVAESYDVSHPRPEDALIEFAGGGGGESTIFVCGFLACNKSVSRPLLDALPRLLRIPIGDGQGFAMVQELLRVGLRESGRVRAGTAPLLAKLAELLFVEALRRYIETLPPDGKGWLAGVRDAQVGRALALIHNDPGRNWTVDELARRAAMSRSALAERFTSLVGESPMQYITRWRLALAAQMLRTSREPIVRIAEQVGYESEAAFTRAFKREFGAPPAGWRRAAVAAA